MKIITATAVALSLTIGNALADVKIKGSDYYEGKTVTIYVGAGASGGTGMYGQLVKNWIGKFIPGNPDIKVKHVSGGGGVRVGKQAVAGVIDSTEGLSIIMFPGSISLAGSAIPTEKSINYNRSGININELFKRRNDRDTRPKLSRNAYLCRRVCKQ